MIDNMAHTSLNSYLSQVSAQCLFLNISLRIIQEPRDSVLQSIGIQLQTVKYNIGLHA